MKKLLTSVIIIVVVLVVAVGIAKNAVAKAAVMGGVKAMTGLTLDIGSMDVGVLRSALGINDLRLRNPAGFPDRYMVELPEIFVDYDLMGFLGGKVHLEEVRLELKQFTVVKDAQGRVNLDSLKTIQESKGTAASKPAKPAEPGKAPQIAIDLLLLKVGKVVYKDYTGGGEPKVQEFAVNLDERYEHITNPQMLAGLIVTRTLMNTSVAKLTGINLNALQSQVQAQMQEAMADAAKQLRGVTGNAMDAASSATDAGKEAVGEAADALKGTTDSLKKMIPFGR